MLLTTLCLLTIAPANASDFFPLVPGTRRTYEERGVVNAMTEDEVGAPEEVSGQPAIPVTTTSGGKAISKTYYRVEADRILIVAYDPAKPLSPVMPVFQLDPNGTANWSVQGLMTAGKDKLDSIALTGTARLAGSREVLGRTVEVIEVRQDAEIGAPGPIERVTQTAIYGKGIGLITFSTKTSLGKRSAQTDLRLVKIVEAKAKG